MIIAPVYWGPDYKLSAYVGLAFAEQERNE